MPRDRGRELPAVELARQVVRDRRSRPRRAGGRARRAARRERARAPFPACRSTPRAAAPPRDRSLSASPRCRPCRGPASTPRRAGARARAPGCRLLVAGQRSSRPPPAGSARRRRPSARPARSRTSRAPSSGRRSPARRRRWPGSRARSRAARAPSPGSVIAANCAPRPPVCSPEVLQVRARLDRRARLGGDDEQRPLEVDAPLEPPDRLGVGGVEDVERLDLERPSQHLGRERRATHAQQHAVVELLGRRLRERVQLVDVRLERA